MIYEKLPISVLIMCQNEEANISYAIESVKDRFAQVIVTDSFSTDKTYEISKSYEEVEFYEHIFEGWAEQRNWMLENCKIDNEIVFFLDADEMVTDKFFDELKAILISNVEFGSIKMISNFIFLGKHLKYSYGHPLIRRIFKKTGLYFKGEGAREYAYCTGVTLEMKNHFLHQDRRPISWWIEKHNRNAQREADLYISKLKENLQIDYANLNYKLKIKLWIRTNIWDNIPLLVRPFFYFIYRYIFQRGFLDGKQGFIFCFLHALWYQMLIDIKIIEKKLDTKK